MTIQQFLWVVAFVLFVVGSFWNPPRVSLYGLASAAFVGGFLFPTL